VEDNPALSSTPDALVAVAQMELGRLLFRNAEEYPAALAMLRQAQAWAREVGNAFVLADALGLQGMVTVSGSDFPGAASLLEESLAISQQEGYEMASINALQQLAISATLQGQHQEAIERAEEALALGRRVGAVRWIGISLSIQGYAELFSGDAVRAEQLFTEALEWRWQVDDRGLIVYELAGLAGTFAAQGRALEAARLLGKVDRLFSRSGTSSIAALLPYIEGTKEVARSQLGEATYHRAWNEGHQMSLEQMVTYALGPGSGTRNGMK
jgi:tetratricopeptide (TPR) repeat protein